MIPKVPAGESYTPGVLVVPPSSTGTVAVLGRPAARDLKRGERFAWDMLS